MIVVMKVEVLVKVAMLLVYRKVPWVQELVIEDMRFLAIMKNHLSAKRFVGYV